MNIYDDIQKRTQGSVFIGVVGAVRTGKSTFIKKFMESLVIPNIVDESEKRRTLDELPQSAGGKTHWNPLKKGFWESRRKNRCIFGATFWTQKEPQAFVFQQLAAFFLR